MPEMTKFIKRSKVKKQTLRRKILSLLLLVVVLLAVLLFVPFLTRYRALTVMYLYDKYCEQYSLPKALELSVEMPLADAGYLPLMITFNDDEGMSAWLDRDVRFTVDYAVADFPSWGRHSHFYDVDHPLYNSYVGAYYLQGYGQDAQNDETGLQLATAIAAFDQQRLALPALGLSSNEAVFELIDAQEEETYFHENQRWTAYNATLKTNGGEHNPEGFLFSYLQFGRPPRTAVDYPIREMHAKFYFTYIEEKDLFLGLYALYADKADRNVIGKELLESSEISFQAK